MTQGILSISCGDTDSLLPPLVASIARHTALPLHIHRDPRQGGMKSRGEKLRMVSLSPFDQTLYLDCDVVLCADVMPLFPLLGRSPLWMAMDVGPRTVSEVLHHRFYERTIAGQTRLELEQAARRLPDLPHFNSGVVLFDRRAEPFCAAWLETWKGLPAGQDQLALLLTCARTGQRPALLGPAWNFQHSQTKDEADLVRCRKDVKVLHLLGQRKSELYRRARDAGYF
jgi:lipopolysaccharide biosynthesis glycosyltransferase